VRVTLVLALAVVWLPTRLVDHEVVLAFAWVHIVGFLLTGLLLTAFLVAVAVLFLHSFATIITDGTLASFLVVFFVFRVVQLTFVRLLVRVLFFH